MTTSVSEQGLSLVYYCSPAEIETQLWKIHVCSDMGILEGDPLIYIDSVTMKTARGVAGYSAGVTVHVFLEPSV